ncbi:HAL/PAL/TAL family ammonia-lyase [Cupriavidus plantarum]|uniref:HAL/PAL/TAL family ammonia-lyase n=1 Tax=Cupriavidus plantarum TaxID=942865 RepID=UPI00339D68D4
MSEITVPDLPDSTATRAPIAPVAFDGTPLTIEDVVALARREATAVLSDAPDFRARITRGMAFLDQLLEEDGRIYGVTTGYGDSCETAVPVDRAWELPVHLYTFHGCGLGRLLDAEETRAVLAARLASLCQGYSAVSPGLLEQLAAFLAHDVLPCIPAEGSVGASGDLTPLSYVAAALCGERDVVYAGRRQPAAEALAAIGREPLRLRPKEALAIMNGTAVMTGLACLAWARAANVAALSATLTAGAVVAIDGNPYHYDETLFRAKPHPGQTRAAARIRTLLGGSRAPRHASRLQDRYSLRCAPHVIGVLEDALDWSRTWIETELNSANDNPLVDPDENRVLHGGHFYGGHIALAMDALKTAVASVADLMDRQLATLVDTRYNNGLPANLSGAVGDEAPLNHGLKAVQIGASAWTAEALKQTMPATAFSRSTECHNQDKVSMGTIASRDCLRVLELTEQVAAGMLVAVRQAIGLRLRYWDATSADATTADATGTRTGTPTEASVPAPLQSFVSRLEAAIPLLERDRALEPELRALLAQIRAGQW